MALPDVTSFTAASVDLLVDFLDGIQIEFGSKPRRDGIVSFQVNTPGERCHAVINTIPLFIFCASQIHLNSCGNPGEVFGSGCVSRCRLKFTAVELHLLSVVCRWCFVNFSFCDNHEACCTRVLVLVEH